MAGEADHRLGSHVKKRGVSTNTATLIVDAREVWLPLILRE
jgi:hypothetical protein